MYNICVAQALTCSILIGNALKFSVDCESKGLQEIPRST